jgi:ferredoxin
MKATVDPNTCTGCGLCTDSCPDVFEMKNGLAVAKPGEIPAGLESAAKQAAADCPVEAITVK